MISGVNYRRYSDFLGEFFEGKVQKLSIDLGAGCPNRDGSKGRGGCIYCSNEAFSPDFAKRSRSVPEQIASGKAFFARKYPRMHYLAYFQSFTPTHSPAFLNALAEAKLQEDVVGAVVSTRPDCIDDALLESMKALEDNDFRILIEIGAETSHDETLRLINRCHLWSDVEDAVTRCHRAGFPTGIHLILGLPGESDDMIFSTIERVNALPVSSVKFHQLQVLAGTRLAQMVRCGEISVRTWTAEDYAILCKEIARRLRPDIAIDRFVAQAPDSMLLSPRWGIKNYQFDHLLDN